MEDHRRSKFHPKLYHPILVHAHSSTQQQQELVDQKISATAMQNNWNNCTYRLSVSKVLALLLLTIFLVWCNANVLLSSSLVVGPCSITTETRVASHAAFVDSCNNPTKRFIQRRNIFPTTITKQQWLTIINSAVPTTTAMRLSNGLLDEETEGFSSSRKVEMKNGDKSSNFLTGDNNNEDYNNDDVPIIFRGEDGDDMPDELWQELIESSENKPSEWTIMKELLGINIFTYVLAATIVFFLGMNALLGPGWLGGVIGLPGTGTFSEMSNSLPNIVDLSESKYQL